MIWVLVMMVTGVVVMMLVLVVVTVLELVVGATLVLPQSLSVPAELLDLQPHWPSDLPAPTCQSGNQSFVGDGTEGSFL